MEIYHKRLELNGFNIQSLEVYKSIFPGKVTFRSGRNKMLFKFYDQTNDTEVGFAILEQKGSNDIYISFVARKDECKGKLIGDQILKEITTIASGLLKGAKKPRITLSVRPSNTSAIKCYLRNGFEVLRITPLIAYFAPNEKAIVMIKRLYHYKRKQKPFVVELLALLIYMAVIYTFMIPATVMLLEAILFFW